MSAPVAHVTLTDPPGAARELMLALGLRHLAVVDPDTGAAVGVLSDRELADPRALRHLGCGPRTVAELVRRCAPIVRPEVDTLTAVECMLDAQADALIVGDATRIPLGIVTGHDLARVLTRIHHDPMAGP
ncbi:CBS domain-containing protein [Embleya scabrispora]|uniref:CBS domain-containing protein n=1 Tax=Embleya scabrispora TaxID=159449 RepID=UPI00036DA69F|nr:CBS domain-containing protein [Embleya scabrispora]MYS80677.1 CBS domain-containing protein [Streptomyces sp. SID5474]